MLTPLFRNGDEGPRIYTDDSGKLHVGVTSAMGLVKTLLGEPPDCYGPPNLAKIHAMEGTAAHRVTLNWLAWKFGWVNAHEIPPWPKNHGNERRWYAIMAAAQRGFQEFVDEYEVVPLGIEQEATKDGLVGHLDLFCSLLWGKQRRRVKAVTDLKFVKAIMESHRLQVRTYSLLSEFKGAQIGLIFHGNRETGKWQLEEVNLTERLGDVLQVWHAARLYAWAAQQKGVRHADAR